MARGQSPYQGQYTVPIADFSGIERAGAAWGDAFKGIGQQVEKYQLKKEQQKKDEGTLKGLATTIETLKASDDSDSAMIYDAGLAALQDPEVPLSQRLAQGQEIVRGLNLSSTIQGRRATSEATEINNKLMSELHETRKNSAIDQGKITKYEALIKKYESADTVEKLQNLQKQRIAATELTEAQKESVETGTKIKLKQEERAAAQFPLLNASLAYDVTGKGLEQQLQQQKLALNKALAGPAQKQAQANVKKTLAEIKSLEAEEKKTLKEITALAGKGGSFIQATGPDGEDIDNVFFPVKANGTQSFTPYLMLPGEAPRPLSSSPSELNSEMRQRLRESRDEYGSEAAGTFTDFEGTGTFDQKMSLSIEQLYDILKFGRAGDEGEWKYDDPDAQITRRYDREQLDDLTPKTKELLRKYTDRRTRIQALPGEKEQGAGNDMGARARAAAIDDL